ncbi:MAG TPA: efflux RND transporter periplasmic adaptor subunit [Fimbriiglobus sp.]
MSNNPTAEAPKGTTSVPDRNKFSRAIDDAFEEASKLAGSTLPPADFYQKFLNRTLTAINAPAGAIWLRTPQGFLQIACQINLENVGLDQKRGGRQCHNEVLRQVFQAQPTRPVLLEPQGRLTGIAEAGPVPAANLTEYYTLFAPIVQNDKSPLGLLEVFQESNHDPRMYPTFLNYTVQMAGYASQYHSFSNVRQSAGLDKVFTQVEAFARLIHTSLNPTEVAYHVANEGRKLVECDRLCVGVRHGKKVVVEAVSGADVVEKASTHVRRMRHLFDAVVTWGDKLIYKGEKDDSLPPQVLHALDDYLAESQPKLLVVMPIKDVEREKDEKKPARSVLLMEAFNPPEMVEPLVQRLDVVGKHASTALYNAAQMKRVPLGLLWKPIAKLQDGLGGKARFYWAAGITTFLAVLAAMILVPYPLKMEAKGELEPIELRYVYPPKGGFVSNILYKQGETVRPGATTVVLDDPELQSDMTKYATELTKAIKSASLIKQQITSTMSFYEANQWYQRLSQAQSDQSTNELLIANLVKLYNADKETYGRFYAKAPGLPRAAGGNWKVLNADNKDFRLGQQVKASEPLLRLGWVDGPWQVTLKIPNRNIGHILKAFADPKQHKKDATGRPYLDVDLLLTSDAHQKYYGRLYKDKITGQAVPNKDDHNESDPIIMAYVAVNQDDVPKDKWISPELFVTGQEIHARIRCGDHALGYSLFHGVWEWFYEKVVFFF